MQRGERGKWRVRRVGVWEMVMSCSGKLLEMVTWARILGGWLALAGTRVRVAAGVARRFGGRRGFRSRMLISGNAAAGSMKADADLPSWVSHKRGFCA